MRRAGSRDDDAHQSEHAALIKGDLAEDRTSATESSEPPRHARRLVGEGAAGLMGIDDAAPTGAVISDL